MTKKPPIPEKERSPKAHGDERTVQKQVPDRQPPENLKEQGHPGNLRQNTRNQGYQQDR
jgi:hypothetical protein